MGRKVIAIWLILITMFSFIVIIVEIAPIVGAQTTWYVDDVPGSGGPEDPPEDFTSIQDAINVSSDRDTVFVYNGTYYENVIVNKTINLTGEDRNTTIIDGGGEGDVVRIVSNYVNISAFTITNSGWVMSPADSGIQIDSNNCSIWENNIIFNNRHGIYLFHSSNNTIKSNYFTSNKDGGIRLESSLNNKIIQNNISSNSNFGILLKYSSKNLIKDNIASKNTEGIFLSFSSENNITNNIISSNNLRAILLHESSWNHLSDNKMIRNGVVIYGNSVEHWNTHVINNSNIVNGKPMYYWKNKTGGEIPQDAGQVILANCTNVNIKNLKITNTSIGIQIGHSFKINITGNNLSSNIQEGLYICYSNNSYIKNNIIYNNSKGIALHRSNMNYILTNNISLNQGYGITVLSSLNRIIANNISNNVDGVKISDDWNNITDNIVANNNIGFRISSSWNNITGNTILNNTLGISLWSKGGNFITCNNISNNEYGIKQPTHYSPWINNSIYHNNFIANINQANEVGGNPNQWDDGYPSGGNYWSDYKGNDSFKGPNQDISGYDGIGDTPYTDILHSSTAQDNYPLMGPYKPLENYTILKQGWNLISIPQIQEEKNLTRVLGSLDSWYDAVQWYKPTDPYDYWKHNRVGKPFGNDLFELNETMGFWIHITNPGDTIFLYNGTQPTQNQTIALNPGWNMVGYPSLTSYNRTEGLNNLTFNDQVDAIWSYDAATQKWEEMGESDYFEIGKGYYIHAKSKCEWEVPL